MLSSFLELFNINYILLRLARSILYDLYFSYFFFCIIEFSVLISIVQISNVNVFIQQKKKVENILTIS